MNIGGGLHTVDSPITVLICLTDHLIYLVISQLFPNRRHDMAKFRRRDESVVVTVEHLECFLDALLVSSKSPFLIHILVHTLISSSESVSFILRAIIVRNSSFTNQ